MEVGQPIQLVDGRGGWYTAVLKEVHPKRAVVDVVAVKTAHYSRPYHLHVAVAPTKQVERLEWFLEKATEVGVDEITPIICEHSERKDVKADRLNKVMVAAMKQSLKAYLPKLNRTTKLSDFLKSRDGGQSFIAHCAEGEKHYLSQLLTPFGRYTILIGPEGDFSTAEIQAAMDRGYAPISLGDTRLRTETAALTACLEVSILNRPH